MPNLIMRFWGVIFAHNDGDASADYEVLPGDTFTLECLELYGNALLKLLRR